MRSLCVLLLALCGAAVVAGALVPSHRLTASSRSFDAPLLVATDLDSGVVLTGPEGEVLFAPNPAPYHIAGQYILGLSSGGFVAVQWLFAYSSETSGAGIFAAGPYCQSRLPLCTCSCCHHAETS
jgi:hypothetical protein